MKFSHLTDTIILFGDEFDNFQTKLIRVGHNLHLKLGVQVLGGRSLLYWLDYANACNSGLIGVSAMLFT